MCREQVFSYTAAYQPPFYNRNISRQEMVDKRKMLEQFQVICISQPLGTGKTFFADELIRQKELELSKGERFLTAKEIAQNPNVLEVTQGDIVVDECDIKTSWKDLRTALEILSTHLANTRRSAILIGDFSLRNNELATLLVNKTYLESFEPLNTKFLEGVISSRVKVFIPEINFESFSVDKLIEPDFMALLTPEWMNNGNSFRRVFSFLQNLAAELPQNNNPCTFTLPMAYEYLNKVEFEDDKQEEFFNLLLEFIRYKHPNGIGIGDGFFDETLFELAHELDFEDMDEFREVILDYFTQFGYLDSLGIPYYDYDVKKHIRRPEPYVPSLEFMIRVMMEAK
jgi:hypothetical protein